MTSVLDPDRENESVTPEFVEELAEVGAQDWDRELYQDRLLVERCQRGDEQAFEALFLRHRDRLYRFCVHRLGSRSEAEDAVQETFLRAWRALPSFGGERRFYPWLSVIASNLCNDMQRRRGRWEVVADRELDVLAPPAAAEQEILVELWGERDILSRALGQLSERHRQVLELREGRNWSYQEIAAFSGVEVSTVETLLFRARRSLRREFMAIARAEGALGVLLVPWYLRRARIRFSSGALRLVHRPLSSQASQRSGTGSPAGGGPASGGAGAGAHVAAVSSSSWWSAVAGLSAGLPSPMFAGGAAAVAAAAVVASGFAYAGEGPPAAAPSVRGQISLAAPVLAHRGSLQAVMRKSSDVSPAAGGTAPRKELTAGSSSLTTTRTGSGTSLLGTGGSDGQSSADHATRSIQSATGVAGSSGVTGERAAAAVSRVAGLSTGAAGGVARTAGEVAGTVTGSAGGVGGAVTGSVGGVAGAAGGVTGAVGKVPGTVSGVAGSLGSAPGTVDDASGTVKSATGKVRSLTGTAGKVSRSLGGLTGAPGKMAAGVGSVAGKVVGKLGGSAGELTGRGATATAGEVTGAVGAASGAVGERVSEQSARPLEQSGTCREQSARPLEQSARPLEQSARPLEQSARPLEQSAGRPRHWSSRRGHWSSRRGHWSSRRGHWSSRERVGSLRDRRGCGWQSRRCGCPCRRGERQPGRHRRDGLDRLEGDDGVGAGIVWSRRSGDAEHNSSGSDRHHERSDSGWPEPRGGDGPQPDPRAQPLDHLLRARWTLESSQARRDVVV